MRTYPVRPAEVRPLWQQVAYIAAAAALMFIAVAMCVLTLVALSPAWGGR